MKISQRLDYNRFAEVLSELGVVEPSTLQHILQQSFNTNELFPEVLVRESLVADWELSRIACEAFHLVFLSVDFYEPSTDAVELFDPAVLHQHCIIPLDCYDELVTIAIPALTPSEVLTGLGEQIGKTIQPVVGTAGSNRRWLMENLPLPTVSNEVVSALPGEIDDSWSSLFDEGDAAVLMELDSEGNASNKQTIEISEAEDTSSLDDLIS